MAIVKCSGPQGQTGWKYRNDATGTEDTCHLEDPKLPKSQARAQALRAASRDANREASHGDERMARDG